jgi:Ca2+-binding RTX toxin-like protein
LFDRLYLQLRRRTRMFRRIRPLFALALVVAAYFAAVQPGAADTNGPFWTCRGSVGYLGSTDATKPGRLEPMTANASDPKQPSPCANDDAGQTEPLGTSSDQGSISVQSVYAGSRITPVLGASSQQQAGAVGQVSSVHIQNADGSFVLNADVTKAGVQGSCNGGVPGFADTGAVTNVNINGQPVTTDEPYQQVGNGLNGSPFGQVTKVFFNETTATGSTTTATQSVTRRAIHVQILDGNGNPVLEAVVGEAIAGRSGPVCQAAPRCPEGTVYDQGRNVCVTQPNCPTDAPREGDVCIRTVTVVGPPGKDQSTGGTIVPLGDVKGVRSTSPCRNKRFGRQVGIIGTSHGDRITGSNKSDRIFVFGGNDRVSGGRGNDCVEGADGSDQLEGSTGSDWLIGGAGNDHISGAQGADYLYGGDGNDKLIGSTGNDRIYGGKGRNVLDGGKGNDRIYGGPDRDYIVAGNGRDVIRAGKGNDDINVATAGARAKVDCGGGVDTIRINNNELHSIKHCENVLVTTRLKRLKSYNESYKKHKKK